MKKVVKYTVSIDVEDNGEFDHCIMRDGIIDGILRVQSEGGLTKVDDETTVITGVWVYRHSIREVQP